MEELNKKIADEGVGACEEYYQCMDCNVIYDGKPQKCECGNDVDNAFAKVLVSKKGRLAENKSENNDGWFAYKKQDEPHFKTVADWLEAVKEIGNENRNCFYACENCHGIFVNNYPDTCTCGNNLEESFKEIDGQMRKQLIDGRPLKELLKHSRE
jgi:hypothetical protein